MTVITFAHFDIVVLQKLKLHKFFDLFQLLLKQCCLASYLFLNICIVKNEQINSRSHLLIIYYYYYLSFRARVACAQPLVVI